ncbi:MAG: hypothetical protein A3H70_04300 [Candidatus Komeilibacteria bacterium RIFCSPLOWO2_02_FULL_48_11]|uniref:DAGKc domain-containing protein n=1 Tax=Candidatus Komeilibacteria bacterium RIFCSPLOWO2_02_FULL_48_11 TaxID=1798553 RepID=A0A1G2BPJ1_9BACT|nr:MAG: hypothetical protein A3H70_04300 [Candidatus Komeilibacteria bacterium RIFCSPLOWO2_02_FULL_48_11]
MFAYFLDDWTAHKRYAREVDSLDLLLTQHGIIGRRLRLGRLHDLDASARDCAASGIRTFVAVGNDGTASKLLNSLLKIDWRPGEKGRSLALAVLPIGEEQKIASCLGSATIPEAVQTLVGRRTESIDVGKLNNRHYFMTLATFPPKVSLGFLSYTVNLLDDEHQVHICNINAFNLKSDRRYQKSFNPQDGTFEAVVTRRPLAVGWKKLFSKERQAGGYQIESVFPHQKITVLSREKTITVVADAEKQLTAPVEVEIEPRKLLVVVGAGNNL